MGMISNKNISNYDLKSLFWFVIVIWNPLDFDDFDFEFKSFLMDFVITRVVRNPKPFHFYDTSSMELALGSISTIQLWT